MHSGADVLHGVINRQSCADNSSRAAHSDTHNDNPPLGEKINRYRVATRDAPIDVHIYRLVRVLSFEEQ